MTTPPVAVEVVRSGLIESRHRATLVLLAAGGSVDGFLGDPGLAVFPRSALKPLQAAAMAELGLAGPGPELAIAASSHDGSDVHVGAVRGILGRAGLTEADLRCPAALPESAEERKLYLRRGGEPDAVHHECSGKHASMLSVSAARGWPLESYLAPSHPLQLAIRAQIRKLTSDTATPAGVDGCGTPVYAVTLAGLARAYSRIATAPPGTPAARVAGAMREYPELVAGAGRDVTELMKDVSGLIAKDGAEGVYGAALPDGRAVAFKIEDGALRACPPLLCEALRSWGLTGDAVSSHAEPSVLGGGQQAGVIRVSRQVRDRLRGGTSQRKAEIR